MSEASIRALPIWHGEVRIEPLSGGITNLNFRVVDGDRVCVARRGEEDPALGISRSNETACARIGAEIGVAPAVRYAADGVAVFDFVAGEPLTPESAQSAIDRVVRELRHIHATPSRYLGHLRYFSPFHVAHAYLRHAAEHRLRLPAGAERLPDRLTALEREIAPFRPVFCHNDLMPGNLLDTGDKLWVIDWEYAGIGHPLFDLAGFSSNCELDDDHDRQLLDGYFGGSPPAREFAVMKAMAALRESLWGVVQGSKSEIDFDYGGYRDDNFAKFERFCAAL